MLAPVKTSVPAPCFVKAVVPEPLTIVPAKVPVTVDVAVTVAVVDAVLLVIRPPAPLSEPIVGLKLARSSVPVVMTRALPLAPRALACPSFQTLVALLSLFVPE